MKPIAAEVNIIINGPIERVWKVLLDTSNYKTWNPFVVNAEAEGDAAVPGNKMKLFVKWRNGKGASSDEIIADTKLPYADSTGVKRAYWSYRFTGLLHTLSLVHATRYHWLEELTDGSTAYSTREEFTGLLKMFIPLADLQDGFERQTGALKREAEKE